MSTNMINCEACGSPMTATDRFCPECGHTNAAAVAASSQPDDAEQTATERVEEMPAETAAFSATEGTDAGEASASSVEEPASAGQPTSVETPSGGEMFTTPMAPPSFAGEEGRVESPLGSVLETPSNETRRVETSTYSETPPTGAPTVNIGQAGYQPPAGWQPGEYSSGQTSASQPPAYSPYPAAQGETPRQPAGEYAPPPQPQYNPPPGYAPTQQNLTQYSEQPQPPVQGYPPPPAYRYGQAATPPRDPTIALLLELIGYAGFLGIGHIYAGKVSRGIALMIGWWFYVGISVVLMVVLIGCVMLLITPFVPILSGLWIRNEVEKENAGLRYR